MYTKTEHLLLIPEETLKNCKDEEAINLYYKFLLRLAKSEIVEMRGGLHNGPDSTIDSLPEELRELTEEYAIGPTYHPNMGFGSPKGKKKSRSPKNKLKKSR